jgi:peptidase YpeB-like protein
VIVCVLGLAFVASQTCQRSQIRTTKEQAIATAKRQVDFEPRRVQIRLLRQGLGSKPFWIVSLSTPGPEQQTFRELAVVRVDANTGKVADVKVQR